jgi:predicted DNA-binding transcriptional regulator AlpA
VTHVPFDLKDLDTIPAEAIPAAILRLSARLVAEPPVPADTSSTSEKQHNNDMLTTAEAAAALRKSVKWLYRHKTLPFVHQLPGGGLLFSREGIEKWLARQKAR